MRRVTTKREEQIIEEWDKIAALRHEQITRGRDVSHRFVLRPCLLGLCADCDQSVVLDAGCGSGVLTAELSFRAEEIYGVDASPQNVQLAANVCKDRPNVRVMNKRLEDLPSVKDLPHFSLAIANMTFMTCLNLRAVLNAVWTILREDGVLCFTIAHPCFWPQYWSYASEPWFSYKAELIIEAPFRISNEQSSLLTTHVHRSLEQYFSCLKDAGFAVDELVEPIPTNEIHAQYPEPWRFPRFIAIRCIRLPRGG